jgi:hypothetical protein
MNSVEKLRKALEKRMVGLVVRQAKKAFLRQEAESENNFSTSPAAICQSSLGHLRAAWKTRITWTISPRTR